MAHVQTLKKGTNLWFCPPFNFYCQICRKGTEAKKNNKHKNNNTGLKNMLGSQQTLFSLVSFESFAPHVSVQKKKRKKSVWLYRKDPKFGQ